MAVIQFKKFHKDIQLPAYATVGSAGFDLVVDNFKTYYNTGGSDYFSPSANVVAELDRIIMYPNSRLLVGCGFAIALPDGYQMEIRSRSGNALHKGLVVANSPGTLDVDYRGEVGVILHNISPNAITVLKGEKVAQGVITEFDVAVFQEVDELTETVRGSGAYGHSNDSGSND